MSYRACQTQDPWPNSSPSWYKPQSLHSKCSAKRSSQDDSSRQAYQWGHLENKCVALTTIQTLDLQLTIPKFYQLSYQDHLIYSSSLNARLWQPTLWQMSANAQENIPASALSRGDWSLISPQMLQSWQKMFNPRCYSSLATMAVRHENCYKMSMFIFDKHSPKVYLNFISLK